jgi:hypothetical protein
VLPLAADGPYGIIVTETHSLNERRRTLALVGSLNTMARDEGLTPP